MTSDGANLVPWLSGSSVVEHEIVTINNKTKSAKTKDVFIGEPHGS